MSRSNPCRSIHTILNLCGTVLALLSNWMLSAQTASPPTITRQTNGILLQTPDDQLQLTVCDPSIIHIRSSPVAATLTIPKADPWIIQPCNQTNFSFTQTQSQATIETSRLKVEISLADGTIAFKDKSDKSLLAEFGANSRTYTPTDPALYQITERFRLSSPNTLYGLGQHQSGLFNYNGSSVTLSQFNSDIGVPFAISTAGYGLLWNSAAKTTFNDQIPARLRSPRAPAKILDFYFFYGPDLDQIIHLYRTLTGHAPLFGKWTYGLIQSKNRYKTQDELTQTVDEYRRRQIPLDAIVQDYYWWTTRGSSDFTSLYPDINRAIRHIHDQHAHVMISIWPNLDPGSALSQQIASRNLFIPHSNVYDATNPVARELYFKSLPSTLLARGIDALWLDASEPEIADGAQGIPSNVNVAAGPGALYTNAFPFFHTGGISQQWRASSDTHRVFLLTRSAFLGQQSNSAAIWSGDIGTDFDTLARQIPAGLNLMLSGIPYWTTDIGGYSSPDPDPNDPKYREVFTRWFEYGTFCPLFRVHGRRIGPTAPPPRPSSSNSTSSATASCPTSTRSPRASPKTTTPSCAPSSWTGAPIRTSPISVTPSCSAPPCSSTPSRKPEPPAAASISRPLLPGTTSGPAKKSAERKPSTPPPPSTASPSTSAPAASSPSAQTCNTPPKNPEPLSNFESTVEPTATSTSTPIRATPTPTKTAHRRSYPSPGTKPPQPSPSAHASAATRQCPNNKPSTSSGSARSTEQAQPLSPPPTKPWRMLEAQSL